MQSNISYTKNVRTKPKAEAFKRAQGALKQQGKAWTRETQKTSQNVFKTF